MNHISKIHKRFSERLNNPRVLTNPEDFLGENYKEVLNFWLIIDELSKEQLRVVNGREETFYNENLSEWGKAANLAIDSSYEVVGFNYADDAAWATYDVTNSNAAYHATRELIGLDLFFQQTKSLKFLSFFI